MIAHYIADKVPGSIEQFTRDGKTYVRVADYQKMHQGVGMLLAELMRIKAEGDYDAIKALVDKYGVHFDPALRDQVLARYKKLNLPTYFAGMNAQIDRQLWERMEKSRRSISIIWTTQSRSTWTTAQCMTRTSDLKGPSCTPVYPWFTLSADG